MSATPLTKVYDVSGTLGGPIRKDRAVVLRDGPHRWQHAGRHRHLLQRERRRCDQVAVHARLPATLLFGSHLRERERPPHLADDASKQAGDVLGRASDVPDLYWRDAGIGRAAADFPRSGGGARPAVPRHAGVIFSGPDEQPAAGSEFRRHLLRCREFRTRAESHARSHPRRRAVRQRLPRERQHSGTGLPVAGLQCRPCRLVPVAGLDLTGQRCPQSEDWLSAHADDRRSHMDDQQPEPHLPRQQRRAEPADAVDLAVGERRACGLGRGVRAGAMDPRPRDAAGRRAVRPRAELVSAAAGRAVALFAGRHRHSRHTRRRQLQGHHAEDGSGN